MFLPVFEGDIVSFSYFREGGFLFRLSAVIKEVHVMDEINEELSLVDTALELIEKKDFHSLHELMADEEPADINEIFDELSDAQTILVFRLLPKELAAEVFVEMDSDKQETLIRSFNDNDLRAILDELYYDDTADIIDEMPASVGKRILSIASPDMRKKVNELLRYPDDSAGSIMTTEFVRLRRDYTISDSLDLIRRVGIDKETIYTCYVTDDKSHLIGIVSAKDLLLTPLQRTVEEIMIDHVISVNTHDDQEQIAQMFRKYDFIALPVVDAENRLVGIITVDDAIDVMQEETEEDFAKMAAILPGDIEYFHTGVLRTFGSRIPWLMLLMVSATFTGMIISKFENALAALPILTAFIPMLMDTGGNSGSQASVTVIRAISLGQVEFRDIFRVLWKEIRVAVLCGVSLCVIAIGKVLLVDRIIMKNPSVDFSIAVVVGLTLLATIICAKIIGSALPILAKKIGFDPAVMASPFITTIVDAVSLLVYFAVASNLIGDRLAG